MFDRLDDILIHYEEIMQELGEPNVTENQDRFRKLMKEHNIPADHIIRHYDVSGKYCPRPFVGADMNTYYHTTGNEQWKKFLERFEDEVVEKSKMIVDGKEVAVERILKNGTNYVKVRDIAAALGLKVSNKGNIAVLDTK